MTRNVLFVHGGGGGAYAADAKLVESLREALGPAYHVRFPAMPNEEEPDYATWKRLILADIADMGEGVILVGHSIGASVMIKLMATLEKPLPLGGVFLLATPFWHDHEIWRWDEAALGADAGARYPRDVPLHFYHGDSDQTVPIAHLAMHARLFDFAKTHRLAGRDHQLNEDLRNVARDIGGLAGGAPR